MERSCNKRENKTENENMKRKEEVKWGKRKEEQNMGIEINNIKSSDLICTNLKDKKWMLKKKRCKKENITNYGEDYGGFCFSSV